MPQSNRVGDGTALGTVRPAPFPGLAGRHRELLGLFWQGLAMAFSHISNQLEPYRVGRLRRTDVPSGTGRVGAGARPLATGRRALR